MHVHGSNDAILIVNPKAGSGPAARTRHRVLAALATGGWQVELAVTTAPGAATELAREAASAGRAAVFVLGGDGSAREAAAGLLGSDTALGVLPGGTTNVVARALGLPMNAAAAAARLRPGRTRRWDVGLCGDEPFLMQASAGLDAAVMAGVDPGLKARLGQVGVALAGLKVWLDYDFPSYQVEVDGACCEAQGVVVANLAEYAGNYRIVPAASAEDGQLDLLLWHGRDRSAALGFALDLGRGRHAARADVEIRPVSSVVLVGPPGAPYQIDGEARRLTVPMAVRLAASRLTVLSPA
jgi:YegS/Rv2252/BmrU family lipid kinase